MQPASQARCCVSECAAKLRSAEQADACTAALSGCVRSAATMAMSAPAWTARTCGSRRTHRKSKRTNGRTEMRTTGRTDEGRSVRWDRGGRAGTGGRLQKTAGETQWPGQTAAALSKRTAEAREMRFAGRT